MRVDILSKEYPPAIYGGAGVHVAELVRALRARGDIDVQVRCFGAPRDEPGTQAYADLTELADANAAMQTLGVDVAWPATASAPTSSTRTRGTPTSPAISPRSSAVCRTS